MRLREVYGEREARRVIVAADELIQAREARGIRTRLVVAEDNPVSDTTGNALALAIARQIAGQVKALEKAGDQLESLLILGGPAIIPFELAANPIEYDGDSRVPSDRIYGTRTLNTLVAEWPVGRLPAAETPGANADLLVRLIRLAAGLHRQMLPGVNGKTFGYSTSAWREASAQVYTEISNTPLVLSPPTVAASLGRAMLDGARAIYCNLHGVREGGAWYGQAEGGDTFFVALRPEDVLATRIGGALVLSEACYGAAVAGKDERSSLAMAFLARGVACFIGATAMSYGPAATPLSEADLIALHFWRAVAAGGTTIGAAFLEARARMLLETLLRQSVLDEDDRKTVLEFVLYGDPTLPLP